MASVKHINSVSEFNFSIYPNPATEKIIVETSTNEVFTLQLLNVLGEVVLPQEKFTMSKELDISMLNSGVYFVNIFNDNKRSVRKIIVD